MDRLTELETYVRVVDSGNISRAAERMGVAKSAVSRRLSDLERRLGAQLLTRTTRQLTVTDAGREFYERCKQLLADMEEAESAVADSHGALRGRLRIAAPVTFGISHLVPLLTEFMRLHPEVQIDVDFSDRHVNLIEDGFDVAVRIGNLQDSSLIARRMAPIRPIVCASPEYLRRHGEPEVPGDLVHHYCMVYTLSAHGTSWPYEAPDGSSGEVQVPIRAAANTGELLREAAIQGEGIILEPTFTIYEAVRRGALVPILTDYRWNELALHAVYPPTRRLARRVRAFVDFLVDNISDPPYWDQPVNARIAERSGGIPRNDRACGAPWGTTIGRDSHG
ncbi:LysR family transcriptional regulator [Thiohalorhabdus sp. Cl-TMA]|uniref:LysR family transcriptional regulator n=1 Tax=Thiohalorhabdus methylotrophus TaxID=3242694 RepID=A0ABV4TYU5_9GAMM